MNDPVRQHLPAGVWDSNRPRGVVVSRVPRSDRDPVPRSASPRTVTMRCAVATQPFQPPRQLRVPPAPVEESGRWIWLGKGAFVCVHQTVVRVRPALSYPLSPMDKVSHAFGPLEQRTSSAEPPARAAAS